MDHSGGKDKRDFCASATQARQTKKVFEFSPTAMAQCHKTNSQKVVVGVRLNTLTLVVLSVTLLLTCYPIKCHCKLGVASDEKEDSSSAGVGESMEDDADAEYMDDEVRFVTEDDFLYEDERSQYRDLHQGARMGGGSLYERCPPLPELEPSAVASSGICDAKRCQRDDECSRDGSVICCYNGCIYACLPKVNPPVAFDWVEETDMKFVPQDQNHDPSLTDPRLSLGLSPRALFNAEISPETITLPGGCFINSKQYEDLLMFRKFNHVRACSCTKGEVFCEINHQPIDIKG